MALIGKITNLFSAANNVADNLSTVAKGVLCIPSILSNLPSILGAVAGNLTSTIVNQALNIAEQLKSTVLALVENTLATITGEIENNIKIITSLIATAAATIGQTVEFIEGLEDRAKDIMNFVKSEENCKFAAASLLTCISASLFKDVTQDFQRKINSKLSSVEDKVSEFTDKLTKPGEVLQSYSRKAGAAIDRANSQLDALTLF